MKNNNLKQPIKRRLTSSENFFVAVNTGETAANLISSSSIKHIIIISTNIRLLDVKANSIRLSLSVLANQSLMRLYKMISTTVVNETRY